MSPTPDARPPSREQLTRIRELSTVVLGDPDLLLDHVGAPETFMEASQMLGALWKSRNLAGKGNEKATPGREADLVAAIQTLKDQPTARPPDPGDTETHRGKTTRGDSPVKKCSRCKETKPLDEFGSNRRAPDGKDYRCRKCRSVVDRESNQRRKRTSKATTTPAQPEPDRTPDLEEPPAVVDRGGGGPLAGLLVRPHSQPPGGSPPAPRRAQPRRRRPHRHLHLGGCVNA